MDHLDHLRRLFAWDDWANREALAALIAAGSPPAAAVRRMAHVVGTEWLWLARLERREKPMAVWPELTLPGCTRELDALAAAWKALLEATTPADLGRQVSYVNSLGESWTGTAGDILLHVPFHSAYHRGQIASDLRAAGFEPAYTDFIHAVRQGFVE